MLSDLEGTFEPVEASRDQLDAIQNTHLEATREIITEQELRKTYYKLAFKQVQYGTYCGKPACVLVVEVLKFAPETVYGRSITEHHSSNWAIACVRLPHLQPQLCLLTCRSRSKVWVNFPGVLLTIDLFDAKLGHTVDYPVDLAARVVGSSRGHPKRNHVVWSLEERSQDGVPHRVPPVVIMVRYQSGERFKAKFS
jgi:hypothetical protein